MYVVFTFAWGRYTWGEATQIRHLYGGQSLQHLIQRERWAHPRAAGAVYVCMYVVCTDSAALAHARTRAHRPTAPRQSSGVSPTPHPTACPQAAGRHSTQTTIGWNVTDGSYTKSTRAHTQKELIRGEGLSKRACHTVYNRPNRQNKPNIADTRATGWHGPRAVNRRAANISASQCLSRHGWAIITDGEYTKGTRAHTHKELIREWIWQL